VEKQLGAFDDKCVKIINHDQRGKEWWTARKRTSLLE
jgi:hypothetical protein